MHYFSPSLHFSIQRVAFFGFLTSPSPPFFRMLYLPALPAYLLRCPQTVKKSTSLSCIRPKFCPLSTAYGPSRLCTLRDLPRRAASISRLVASRARTHTHVTEERGNCDFVTHDEQRRHRSFIREKLYSFASSGTLRDLWCNIRDTVV